MSTLRDLRNDAKRRGCSVDVVRPRGMLDVTVWAPTGKAFTATSAGMIVGHQLPGMTEADVVDDVLSRMTDGFEGGR